MELEDLKARWQKDTNVHTRLNTKDMQNIQTILTGKAADMITSLKRKYEKIIGTMLGGMLLIVLVFPFLSDGFSWPGSVSGFAKAMFFYLILILFYWAKLKTVNNLELSDHIKERLEQLLTMLNKNLRIELYFVAAFFVAFIVIGRFFYGHGLEGILKPEVIGGSVIAVAFTGLVLLLINRRYKKQISELEGYLGEYEKAV